MQCEICLKNYNAYLLNICIYVMIIMNVRRCFTKENKTEKEWEKFMRLWWKHFQFQFWIICRPTSLGIDTCRISDFHSIIWIYFYVYIDKCLGMNSFYSVNNFKIIYYQDIYSACWWPASLKFSFLSQVIQFCIAASKGSLSFWNENVAV